MKNLGLTLCFLTFHLTACLAGDIHVSDVTKILNITEHISYHHDVDKKYDATTICTAPFTTIQSTFFSHSPTLNSIWFKFTINNTSTEPVWLSLKNSSLIHATTYRETTPTSTFIDSSHFSCKENKSTKLWPNFLLASPGEHNTIYIKTTMNLPHIYQFKIGSKDGLSAGEAPLQLIAFFFIGGIFLLFLYNLALVFYLKSKLYLIYCSYLFFIMITALYVADFPIFVKLFGSTLTFEYPILWVSSYVITSLLFAFHYLQINRFIRLKRLYWIAGLVMLVFAVTALFFPLPAIIPYIRVPILLSLLLCLFSGIYLSLKKETNAKIYAAGWVFSILGTYTAIATMAGVIPYSLIGQNMALIGTMLEVVLFSIGLARMIQVLKLEQTKLNEQLKLSNEKYLNLNSSLDSFNYHVSHDLKTVINNMLSLTRMAKKYYKKQDIDKMTGIFNRLENVGNNGKETVASFLNLSQLDQLNNINEKENLSIKTYFFDIIKKHELKDKLDISFLEQQFNTIEIHPIILESIILNLLTNAIKYCAKKPQIEVYLTFNGGYGIISVSDNGIGIDLEKHETNLFKPFKRIPNSLNKEGSGVGLFTINKHMITHNGFINVDSKLGDGTTFHLHFPMEILE